MSKLLALALIALCFASRSPRNMPAKYWMLALLVVPMFSFLPAWLENGQSLTASFSAYLPMGMALVFFILHKARIRPSYLICSLVLFALIRLGIYVIQQFTYPHYLFSFRPEGLNALGTFVGIEVRSGIHRFYIEDTYLSMFLVFFFLQRVLKSRRIFDLALFLVGLVGVYLDQSRQFMVSTLVAVLFVLFFASKIPHKTWILLGLGAVAAVFFFWFGGLFEDLIDITEGDISADNIRLLAYSTYALEYWGGPLSVLFGNGPIGNSAYGKDVAYMYDTLHVYHADVGLVGAANLYGVVTALLFLAFYVFFVFRNWRKMEMYLKMYYIALLVNVPLVTIYTQNINWFVFFAFMLYLTDRDIIRYERLGLKAHI